VKEAVIKYNRLSLKALNELVEFRTSIGIITSVFIGTGYGYFVSKSINFPLFLAMIIASILLDGAATVFNNFFDYKKAINKDGYLYNVHNPIVARGISPIIAFLIGLLLIGVAGILGIYIVIKTHWILLLVGGVSILIAYFYSGGKYPISYSPFGEIVSGLFEGSIVFGIAYFIQTSDFSITVFLVSLPISLGIANIMLANNTSDVDEDTKNGRKTLPIVIGQDNGVKVLYLSHALMFILNGLYFILGYMPYSIFLTYLLIPLAIKNLNLFNRTRTKSNGFIHVLKNTILFNILEIISLFLFAIFA